MNFTKLLIVPFFLFSSLIAHSQEYSNLRIKAFYPISETFIFDSLIIVPQSQILIINNEILPDSIYSIDYVKARIHFLKKQWGLNDTLIIKYRVFTELTHNNYSHRNPSITILSGPVVAYPDYPTRQQTQNFFTDTQLDKRGSLSRGISVGNNQDASVSSNLNLQIAGKLSDNLNILAAISDENIPIQPDGNSQQLQEFDKVFIQIYNEKTKLIAGDFEIEKPVGYFLNINKRGQGGLINTIFSGKNNNKSTFETTVSGAVSKGKYCRKTFTGQEGNQGPYKITGCENELYIIILAGSEKVFIDGKLKTRGKENDYIIDYNTSELTFTANCPITKDSRIAIEFEYSEKSFARFMIATNNVLKTESGNFWFNVFSEHDSKNQSLTQDLSNEQKLLLSQLGDNIENAYTPYVDSINFSSDYVLYEKKDTLVNSINYTIYEYSTNAQKAFYKLGFSLVGANQGNYIQTQTSANGRVFKWIAPIDGKPQGNYEPVRLLITPKSKQLITLGGEIKAGSATQTFFELAMSNSDLNTFSDFDQEDNVGYALKVGVKQNILLKDTLKNALITSLQYEYLHPDFDAFERFKPIEFERDWNIFQQKKGSQHFGNLDLTYRHRKNIYGHYEFGILKTDNNYSGNKNSLSFVLNLYGLDFNLSGSLLNTNSALNTTQFFRYRANLSKSFRHLRTGAFIESEKNLWNNAVSDSLISNSFYFNTYRFYIENPDSSINKYSISYTLRDDYLPKENSLSHSSRAQDFQLGIGILKNPNQVFRTLVTYRKLNITDTILAFQKPQDNITGRLEYNFKIFKGLINSQTFYEAGSGLEPKREFSYLRVTPGQGIYAWNDYNNNGIAELDEFELAQFQDEANYIRVFTPGTDYIKTYQNELSEIFNLRPSAIWRSKSGFKKFVSLFSNQFAYQINQKSTNENLAESLNPFSSKLNLSELITINKNLRNTLSFKTFNSSFGLDYIYQQNHNRILLTNGIDNREREEHNLRLRWQFHEDFTLINSAESSEKKYRSEYFFSKNYTLLGLANEIKIQYMPGYKTKIELLYKYSQKENLLQIEQSKIQTFGGEINYGIPGKGNLQLKANYLNIKYNSPINTSLAYEMLEGLKPGNNGTWSMAYQQKFAGNIELSLLYNGRYSENIHIIHTGSIQLRAFF